MMLVLGICRVRQETEQIRLANHYFNILGVVGMSAFTQVTLASSKVCLPAEK
jgi:hypothetical protein